MSTPQKLTTAIGLIVGGMGAGVLHQENPAMKALQSTIDADIDSQKEDLGKKKSLLEANMKQFGVLADAQKMTRAQMMDMATLEMKKVAAQMQDPMAKARLMTEVGKLEAQAHATMQPLLMKQQVMKGLSDGSLDPEVAVNHVIDPKDRDEARKEIATFRTYQSGTRDVNKLLNEASKIGAIGANTPFSTSKAQFGSIRAQLSKTLRDMNRGLGTMTDSDAESVIDPLLPNSTDTKEQLAVKQQGIKDLMKTKLRGGTPVLKSYGISLGDPDTPVLNQQEKQWVDWARKNPKDPRSAMVMKKLGVM